MTDRCDALIPVLLRAAEGDVNGDDRVQLDAHLATCASCAEALADQRAMRQALVALSADTITTYVGGRVLAGLREDARTKSAAGWLDSLDWRHWTWRLVPVAAAMAIAVASVARSSATTDTVSEEGATTRPVSSALVTGDVTGDDLLSLLLNASADETLVTTTQGGTQ